MAASSQMHNLTTLIKRYVSSLNPNGVHLARSHATSHLLPKLSR